MVAHVIIVSPQSQLGLDLGLGLGLRGPDLGPGPDNNNTDLHGHALREIPLRVLQIRVRCAPRQLF